MSSRLDCSACESLLFDLVDGQLPKDSQLRVNEHLGQCENCNAALADLWQLSAAATAWQERPVPRWNRRQLFFEGSGWLPMLQLASTAVSVLVMVMVLGQVRVSTADGFAIAFGEPALQQDDLTRTVAALREEQQQLLDERVSRLKNQQVASNQLLLGTLLQVTRDERREDFSNLVSVWEETQGRQSQRAEAGLRYVLANQLQDRRNIQQLGQAIALVASDGGTL